MKPKCVVLLSGGMDSTVAAYWAKKKFKDGVTLFIWYDQRHYKKEIESAIQISRLLNWSFGQKSLVFDEFSSSALTNSLRNINEKVRKLPASFVPGRNLFFITAIAAFCYTRKISNIVGGWNAVDWSGYPDCRPNFLRAAETAINTALGLEKKPYLYINIRAPLVGMNKAQIIQLGTKLNVPFEHTWSCYEGRDKPCGKCGACKQRAKGFREAGLEDPL